MEGQTVEVEEVEEVDEVDEVAAAKAKAPDPERAHPRRVPPRPRHVANRRATHVLRREVSSGEGVLERAGDLGHPEEQDADEEVEQELFHFI